MRSVKPLLFVIGAGAIVCNAVVACSTGEQGRIGYAEEHDGSSDPILPETDATAPPTDNPPPRKGGDPGTDDGGDGGTGYGNDVDASDDGPVTPDPDAGAPGSVCPTKDTVQQQACGLCGVQYRLCAPPDDADPGSPNVWQPWGYCQDEVAGGCVPGTSTTEACGLCGTRLKVCQNDCTWAVGACKNEPANACAPGTLEYQAGLSCSAGGRQRICQDDCTFSAFGPCFVPGALTLPSTAGGTVTGQYKLEMATSTGRLGGTCPNATTSSTISPYVYVELVNPTTSTLTVTVWTHKASGVNAPSIDTVIASYGNTKPTTAAERKVCIKGTNDTCTANAPGPNTCTGSPWAGLWGSNAVTVPPKDKVYIYVGGWDSNAVGDFQLTARTDSVN